MTLKIYGSRASMPYFARENARFGGNTTCARLQTGGHNIILDCGSGAMQLARDLRSESGDWPVKLDILLGHLHLDHIIGLSTFSHIFSEGNEIRIYTKSRGPLSLNEQVFGVFKPPYWPVRLADINSTELFEIFEDTPFSPANGITVTPFKSAHPDDTTAFKIEAEGKTIVNLVDCEIEGNFDVLTPYCENADLVILDTAYLPADYESKHGWGHSTFRNGITLAEKSHCKKMLFTHFSQDYTDKTLDTVVREVEAAGDMYIFAHDGLELTL